MKLNRLIKVLLILSLMFNILMIKAQKVNYEIIRNNLDSVKNFGVVIEPIIFSGIDIFNYNIGADIFYRYNDKLLLNADYSYGVFSDVIGQIGKNSSGIKTYSELLPQYNLNMEVAYFPISFIFNYETKIKLIDGAFIETYTKIPLNHQLLTGLRFGYTNHRNAFNTDGKSTPIKGKLIGDAGDFVDLSGKFNYSFHALKIGLCLYVKSNYAVKIGSNKVWLSGVKKGHGAIRIYADYLYPIKQDLNDMVNVVSSGFGTDTYKYEIKSDNPWAKGGLIIGMKSFKVTKKNYLASSRLMLGLLPGPNKAKNNIYITAGFGFGIGKYYN